MRVFTAALTALTLTVSAGAVQAACEDGEIVIKFSHVTNTDKHPKGIAASLLQDADRRAGRAPPDPLETLTQRERQILQELAKGASNKAIAHALDLSEKTVKHHMTNILQKLQVRNRVEAAILAQKAVSTGD